MNYYYPGIFLWILGCNYLFDVLLRKPWGHRINLVGAAVGTFFVILINKI